MSLLPFLQVLLRRQLQSHTGPLSSSLAPLAIEEANTAVTRVREEAAAKKRGQYHHLSVSVHAVIGKYASEHGNSASARHKNFNLTQLFGVFEIIIAKILCPCKNSEILAAENFRLYSIQMYMYVHNSD